MAATKVQNVSGAPATLPYPLAGTLAPGEGVVLALTKKEVLAIIGTSNALRLTTLAANAPTSAFHTGFANTGLPASEIEPSPNENDVLTTVSGAPLETDWSSPQSAGAISQYTLDTATADAKPGAGLFRFDDTTPANITAVFVDDVNADGSNVSDVFQKMTIGDTLVVSAVNDGSLLYVFTLNADAVAAAGYTQLSVDIAQLNGDIPLSTLCALAVRFTNEDTFLELLDTPQTYAGQATRAPVVNAAQTGLEFSAYPLIANMTTGILAGGDILFGASAGEVSITDGNGVIVDYSVPGVPVATRVTWANLTDIPIAAIATTQITFLLIDSVGALVQISGSLPSESQLRGLIFLGWVQHADNATIGDIISRRRLAYNASQDIKIFTGVFEPTILSGFTITGVTATLSFDSAAGELYVEGGNFNVDPNNPSKVSVAAQTPVTFARLFTDGVQAGETNFDTESTTFLDPANKDDAGSLVVVGGGANAATLQRLYITPEGKEFVAYGQQTFNTLTDAVSTAGNEPFIESALMLVSQLVGRWAIAKNATDTTLTTQAQFIRAAAGGGGGGGGGGGATDFLSLTDTPSSYSGLALQHLRVNAGESALELVPLVEAELDDGNTGGGAFSFSFDTAQNIRATLTGNASVTLPTPLVGFRHFQAKILTGAGGFDITFATSVLWADGVAYSATQTAGATDILNFYHDGSQWYGQFRLGFA